MGASISVVKFKAWSCEMGQTLQEGSLKLELVFKKFKEEVHLKLTTSIGSTFCPFLQNVVIAQDIKF